MAGSKKVTVGFKYYLGAHMIFCHGPVDAVTRIMVDGRTAWSGSSTGGAININAPGLFGGEKREGGVAGQVDAAFGAPDQARNSYLQARLGADIPAFRGVFGFILRQVYIGNNPYLKRWGIIARRILKKSNGSDQWYPSRAAIGQDMNPAHIIRECLTDPTWGMGYNENDMGSSFTTAADQLHSEGMGISILWDKSMQLDEFISLILQHIDGSLYVSRDTGKFELKLSRDDYNINTLLVLDHDSISRVENFKRKTTAELTNQVTVIFWDQRTTNDNSVTVQDIALTQQQQATIGTTIQYPGFTVAEIATRVASRDLRALSVPTASCTIYANRKAAGLNVGDVFKLSWPRFGITQVVMRIANIELGSLDKNEVKIDCTEDIFALSSAIYAPPPSSEWTNPQVAPAPCPFHSVIEAPYYELAQRSGDEIAQALSATSGFVLSTGVRPSSAAFNATIWTNPGSGWEEAGTTDFCPTATISDNVSITQTTWPIANGIDLDIVRIGSYASIGTEIVRVDTLSDSSITTGRGCLDTVPVAHGAGARLMFIDDFHESDEVEYTQSEVVSTRLTPTTSLGTLDVASAPTQNVTIQSRQFKPYPPGNFKMNGVAYPSSVENVESITVTWSHRDRLLQTVDVIDTTVGDIGPEPDTTYTAELRRVAGDVLIDSQTGITGTSCIFTAGASISSGTLRIILYSVRDGVVSWQQHNYTFEYIYEAGLEQILIPLTYDETAEIVV